MFWQRKNEKITDKSELEGKITVLRAEVEALQIRVDMLGTNLNSLRGLINRKLRGGGNLLVDDEGLTPQQREFLSNTPEAFFQARNESVNNPEGVEF